MRIWASIGVLAALLVGLSGAAAQDLPTQQLAFPKDLDIDHPPNWAYDPAVGRLLLGIDRRGLYATRDVGESWSRVDEGSYRGIHAATERPGWLIPGPAKGSFYSLVRSPGELPGNPSFFRSLDGGRTWRPVEMKGITPEAWHLLFVPGSPGAFYVMTLYPQIDETDLKLVGPRLWYSPDDGRTVRRIDDYPSNPNFLIVDVGMVGSSLCVALNTRRFEPRKMYDVKLSCRDASGGPWRDLVIYTAPDRRPGDAVDRFWTDKSGAIAALAGTGLYVSTDGGKSFKRRLTLEDKATRILLHPTDTYPVYLSQIDEPGHTIVYRLDADYALTKLGALPGFLEAVDFGRGAGIAENLKDKRFYKVKLR